jgi:hypothetical protein
VTNLAFNSSVPTFGELGFAGQMIVWATRKRLHVAASGVADENVREAFRLGNLERLYAALTAIADVLSCGAARSLQLHAVSCPRLAPHELGILDAIAHLQNDRKGLAYQRVVEVFGAVVARFIWQSMCAIVKELDERRLSVAPIDGAPSFAIPGQRTNVTIH